MSNFHVGQKVVCVNAAPLDAMSVMDGLTKGAVYTIRWIGCYPFPEIMTCLGVRVDEIFRPPCQLYGLEDVPYLASRFRPVRTTDISLFTAMLAPAPRVKERA